MTLPHILLIILIHHAKEDMPPTSHFNFIEGNNYKSIPLSAYKWKGKLSDILRSIEDY